MANVFRYYRALQSVSIASALSTALTIYPCQIRVHQRWQSKLQLLTARKKECRPATAGSSPRAVTCQHCDAHYFSRPRTRNLPIVGWLLVRVVPPTHHVYIYLATAVAARDSHFTHDTFRVPVTRVLHKVSNKFEVSTAFQFWVNRRHGTGGSTACNTSSAWFKCTLAANQRYRLVCRRL